MSDKKRILLICFDNPFVLPMEGGKRGMLSRIEALAEMDYFIDVVLLTKRSEVNNRKKSHIVSEKIKYHEFLMKESYKCILSTYPLSVEKRLTKECTEFLRRRKYYVAIYEGEHVSEYRFRNIVTADKHILYMHDIESSYRLELSETEEKPLKRIAQKVESIKYKKLEKNLPKLFNKFLFVSKDEQILFEKEYNLPKGNTIYSPYALSDFAKSAIKNKDRKNLLYIGNLKLKNNYLSILWFVRNVFSDIYKRNKSINLNIIGDIDDSLKDELTRENNNIKVMGYVEDLNREIQNAALIISPVLYGAGVKVKLIDAISRGQIVVANEKAIEGTYLKHGKHLIVSKSAKDFADYCLDIVKNRTKYEKISSEGLSFVKAEHSIQHHKDVLMEAIEG